MPNETEVTDEMVEAGAAVLREMEPDWFLGWPKNAHYGLVSNITLAVYRASDKAGRAPSDSA